MKKTNILQTVKLIVLGLVLSVGTSYLFADYVAPTFAPPTCPTSTPGCNEPLNTGITAQAKNGSITLGSATASAVPTLNLRVVGSSILDALTTQTLTVTNGAASGKVLVSDATGNATWKDPEDFLEYSSSFAFKRSGTLNADAVTYCPTTHPYVISCSTVDNDAPAVSSLETMTSPCTAGSEGGCNTSPANTSYPQTRDHLDPEYQYRELVRSTTTSTWGCLVYDVGHTHTAYKIDLICSK